MCSSSSSIAGLPPKITRILFPKNSTRSACQALPGTGACGRAVGFDFDGAEFTHVGSRVTFEVLLGSFGLDGDPALASVGHAVHFLDIGGIPAADAKGLETMLRGIKAKARSDNEAALEAAKVFDLFYSAYAQKR